MKTFYILIITFIYTINAYGVENKELKNYIEKYLHKNKIYDDFKISKKIKLPSCKKDLKLRKKFGSFKTLEILCPQKNSWTYLVRTNLKNTKRKEKINYKNKNRTVKLIKLKTNIIKGNKITKNDIVLENTNTPGSSNYFTNELDIIGKKAKITLRKGQILRLRHIEKDWTVQEGQKVIIENNKNNIVILVDGVATHSAMKGEYMRVLNKSTGKIVNAWVKNNKKVSIFR